MSGYYSAENQTFWKLNQWYGGGGISPVRETKWGPLQNQMCVLVSPPPFSRLLTLPARVWLFLPNKSSQNYTIKHSPLRPVQIISKFVSVGKDTHKIRDKNEGLWDNQFIMKDILTLVKTDKI